MKKINFILLISGISALLISLGFFVASNLNFIKKEKFINILENIIKILIRNRNIKLLNDLFDNLINLKRVQSIEFIDDKNLRIIKNKPLNKKIKSYKIEKDIYDNNRYSGRIKLEIIA